MNHADHVALIRGGVHRQGGMWADFGSGAGAFTLALADLIGPEGVIYSVDRDRSALAEQERAMRSRFPAAVLHTLAADFTRPVPIPPLDGIVVANALHFQRDQDRVVQLLRSYLKPGGRLLLVEYNIEHGSLAVPYPVSFRQWEALS